MIRKITVGIAKGIVKASEITAAAIGFAFLISILTGFTQSTVGFRICCALMLAVVIGLNVYTEVTKEAGSHGKVDEN